MPQLNPGPWFKILLMSWMIFLALMVSKTMNFKDTNYPPSPSLNTILPQPWNWPWL
uniref:ATP synthase complex subunit 8 n=1 Tax=Siren lacertina TaxID=307977 RepID=A0A343A0L0_9AMPH|nr:ATP synthase F0 subunit 8 [Siren lacertina]AOW71043.1 ATP synthase F0 subunit 8 [Siren lacertina]